MMGFLELGIGNLELGIRNLPARLNAVRTGNLEFVRTVQQFGRGIWKSKDNRMYEGRIQNIRYLISDIRYLITITN